MDALLIVDVQNDFLSGGALAVEGGDRVIPVINALQEQFELVLATKDWHPSDHFSFEELWPEHCVQETPGAAFPDSLNTDKIARVFYKGCQVNQEGYSAFAESDLALYLRGKGVERLTVVGLATDYCVKTTVLDALREGFEVRVVKEGCAAIGDESAALEEMAHAGAIIISFNAEHRRD